jgi:hypothetical protein
MMEGVTVAVEGPADEAVARRVLGHMGHAADAVHICAGKGNLDRRLAGFNAAARHWYWLVLRDLDRDAECAPALVTSILAQRAEHMVFCVAVRQAEAWMLGDREALAAFLGVSARRVPMDPEVLDNPKHALVRLAETSRRRAIREDIVPRTGSTARVGPGYTGRAIEFTSTLWRPAVAARSCPSLRRCIDALREWPT